jgi:hypothetical protein
MKVTSSFALVTICATAASAFGLNGGAASLSRATLGNVGIANKPMVQPVDVQGQRLSSVVSTAKGLNRIIDVRGFSYVYTAALLGAI